MHLCQQTLTQPNSPARVLIPGRGSRAVSPGAGKSTYARALEAVGWVRFSTDREAYAMGYTSAPLPLEVRDDIRARQRLGIKEALESGSDVVADYAFWLRAQRDDYRTLGRSCGATVEVIYFDVPEDVIRERLAARRAEHADDMLVRGNLLTDYIAGFEIPGADEDDVTVVSFRP
ncbi:MAG: ATP-binding protein [Nocardioidaceae bacterium]|nr:ATP-binding protein [Nocardioidaceae bacterium]